MARGGSTTTVSLLQRRAPEAGPLEEGAVAIPAGTDLQAPGLSGGAHPATARRVRAGICRRNSNADPLRYVESRDTDFVNSIASAEPGGQTG
jgi:hypothetical protein